MSPTEGTTSTGSGAPPVPPPQTGRRGCLATLSSTGSWLSLLGAGASWMVSAFFLVLGMLALDGQLDGLLWDVGTTAEGDFDLLLFVFEFIVLGVLVIGFVTVVFLGVVLPALLAGALHVVGIVSSVGTLTASTGKGGSRLAGLAALFVHLGGVAAAALWFLFWVFSVAAAETPPPPGP